MEALAGGLDILHQLCLPLHHLLLQAVYDKTGRLVALGLGVIVLCLIQIYRGNSNRKEKFKKAVKQAPQRVVQQVHEIADAVEEVKEFVRPTREKVRQ